jgi:lipoprotein LprG
MRRLLIVLAVSSVAVVVVGGCSSPFSPPSPPSSGVSGASGSSAPSSSPTKQADYPLPDPAVLLQEASTTAQALQSAHLVMSVVGKVAETPVKSLEADVTKENEGVAKGGAPSPTAKSGEPGPKDTKQTTAAEDGDAGAAAHSNAVAKGRGKIEILGAEVEFQFVVFGGHLYVALPDAAWVDYGPTSRPYNVTTLLNPDEGLANVLNNFVDPKVQARETVRGQQTIRVTGKVTPTAVNKFMPQLGATDRMPSTVWIQEGGDRQVVEVSLEPSKGNFVQLVFSDWNEPVTVEKPPGV